MSKKQEPIFDHHYRHYIKLVLILLSIIACCTLIWFYIWKVDSETPYVSLGIDLVPELLGALIIFVILYIMFISRGLRLDDILYSSRALWLTSGYESFKQIDWAGRLSNATKIVVVAFYFDNWVIKYDEAVREFLNRKKTKMIVFLPNYENDHLLENIAHLIPKYTKAQLSEKIQKSIVLIRERMEQDEVDLKKVDFWLYDHVFNYTLQAFDNRLFLSVNELRRDNEYKSPFIELNMSHSTTIYNFFSEEIRILQSGKLINSEDVKID